MICGYDGTPPTIEEETEQISLPSMMLKCENGHEFPLIIAPWYFSLKELNCLCPVCKKPAVDGKWGGLLTLNGK